MSDSVGSISVKMGVDLAEFDSGLRKAADDATAHVGRISSSMKQTSREGSESLRVIDEMIGIHLNRPLTRLIVEKFPALAEGLAGALNTVAFGAVGFAVTELGARIVAGIEKAKKAQEEFQAATLKARDVYEDAMASYEKSGMEAALRLAALGGDTSAVLKLKILDIDSAAAERAKQTIDGLTEATKKMSQAAEDAGHWYTALLADIGTAWDFATEGQAGLNLDAIDKQMEVFKENIAETSRLDALHGTHLTAIELTEELNQARNTLEEMKAVNEGRVEKGGDFRASGLPGPGPFTDAEMAKQNALVDLKQRSLNEQKGSDHAASIERATAAMEANERAVRVMEQAARAANQQADSLVKLMQAAMPAKDAITQLDEAFRKELSGLRELVFLEGPTEAAKRLGMSLADAAKAMRDFNVEKESSQQLGQFLQHGVPGMKPQALPELSTPTSAPQYGGLDGAGMASAQAQFDKFKTDLVAQNKLLASSFEESIPPEVKHQLALQEIAFTFEQLVPEIRNTAAAQAAYQAAVKQADDAMVAATDHVHKMQDEMEKLLEHSTSAADGLRAFALQVQIAGAENGKFAFSFADQAFKDFEDGIAKTILATANQQGQLRQMWQNYFKSLEEMAIKFSMDKVFASVLQQTGLGAQQKPGTVPAGGPAGESAPASTTSGGILGSVLGKAGGLIGEIFGIKSPQSTPGAAAPAQAAISSSLEAAAIQLKLAGTQLQSAAQALQSSAGGGMGIGTGDSGGGGGGGGIWGELAGFAGYLIPHESGGDATPGQGYLVGEKGPEAFFPKSAGTVMPHDSLRGSGDVHIHNYDLRGADPAAVARLERALPMIEDRAVARAQSMQRESGLRKRPG